MHTPPRAKQTHSRRLFKAKTANPAVQRHGLYGSGLAKASSGILEAANKDAFTTNTTVTVNADGMLRNDVAHKLQTVTVQDNPLVLGAVFWAQHRNQHPIPVLVFHASGKERSRGA